MTEMSTEQNDRLVNDLRVVISDAEELLRSTAGDVGATASELRVRMQARLQQAKANLVQLQETAVARAKAPAWPPTTSSTRTPGKPSARPPAPGW